MPKYLVHCDTGFCGVNDDVIVTAESESEAEEQAQQWWDDQVSPSVDVTQEIDKDSDEFDDYEEIT